VLKTPFIELLKHMELLLQKEEAEGKKEEIDRWLDFLTSMYSHPFTDPKERKKFMELIKPENVTEKEIPKFETDLKLLEQLKAMQGGG